VAGNNYQFDTASPEVRQCAAALRFTKWSSAAKRNGRQAF
jgi:hypothetical protein